MALWQQDPYHFLYPARRLSIFLIEEIEGVSGLTSLTVEISTDLPNWNTFPISLTGGGYVTKI